MIRLSVKCKTCGRAFFSGIAVASLEVITTSAFVSSEHQCPSGHVRRYAKPDYFPSNASASRKQ